MTFHAPRLRGSFSFVTQINQITMRTGKPKPVQKTENLPVKKAKNRSTAGMKKFVGHAPGQRTMVVTTNLSIASLEAKHVGFNFRKVSKHFTI